MAKWNNNNINLCHYIELNETLSCTLNCRNNDKNWTNKFIKLCWLNKFLRIQSTAWTVSLFIFFQIIPRKRKRALFSASSYQSIRFKIWICSIRFSRVQAARRGSRRSANLFSINWLVWKIHQTRTRLITAFAERKKKKKIKTTLASFFPAQKERKKKY